MRRRYRELEPDRLDDRGSRLKVKPDAKLIQFAIEMARRADEKSKGKNGSIVDTLAKAYFDSGDAEKAVEAQERAIRLTKDERRARGPGMKDRLEKYKKAAKKVRSRQETALGPHVEAGLRERRLAVASGGPSIED